MNGSLLTQALNQLVNAEPVKVKRSELAKRHELIGIKKGGDVGYDLPCIEDVVINPGERRTVSTGIFLEMPSHLWATIEGRSSASKWEYSEAKDIMSRCTLGRHRPDANIIDTGNNEANIPKFLVVTGIIDTGYRGELKAVLVNVGPLSVSVKAGERYAQVIFHLRCTPSVVEVDELSESERGNTGFGSSGK